MNAETIFHWLQEHKEKLLFGFVVLLVLLIVMGAPIGGANLPRVDEEARAQAAARAKIPGEQADRLQKQISEPVPPREVVVADAKITGMFFDDRAKFDSKNTSAWQLGAESFEKLPPVAMDMPGFPRMNDFDIVTGPRPAPEAMLGYVPRDTRKVILTAPDVTEFGPKRDG